MTRINENMMGMSEVIEELRGMHDEKKEAFTGIEKNDTKRC